MSINTLFAIGFALLNFIFKILYLDSNSLAGDEPFSVYHAQMDVPSIISELLAGNNPPLYELILHFWIRSFGISEFAVRFPSLIFNSIGCFFIFKIGSQFFNLRTGIVAAFLFVFSNYQIFFAHEARTYALMGMFTIISMYCFLNLILKTTHRTGATFIALLAADILLIYSHYFGFFVLFIQFFMIIIDSELRNKFGKYLWIGCAIITLFYLPNIPVIMHRFFASSTGTWVKAPTGISDLYIMLWQFSNAPIVAVSLILLFLTTLTKYIFREKLKSILPQSRLIIFWFCIPFFLMFIISFKIPMFMDRYLMIAASAFTLLIAICINYLFINKKWVMAASLLICILFAITSKPNITNKRDIKFAVEKVKTLKSPHSIVFVSPDWIELGFLYYYNIDYFKTTKINKISQVLMQDNIYPIKDISRISPILLNKADKVIFMDAASEFSYPNNKIKETLASFLSLKSKTHFKEIFDIYEFEKQ